MVRQETRQRRTGSRWYGVLGVAALDLALVAIGAAGLYWLLAHVLLAEGSTHGWLAWSAIVIPIAPIVYGVTDSLSSSGETWRRPSGGPRSCKWPPIGKCPGLDRQPRRPALPAVPPIDAVVESAGVRLAYRLPSDAASGQMSFALGCRGRRFGTRSSRGS